MKEAMALLLRAGPGLANDGLVAVTPAQSLPLLRRPQPKDTSGRRRPDDPDVLPLAFLAVAAAALVGASYPAWRVAVFALPALVQRLQRRALRRRGPKTCANVDRDGEAWRAVMSQLVILVPRWGAVAVTGAIASPFLVTIVTPYLSALLVAGDRGATRALLAATSVAVCGLAALPRAWSGPELPQSIHGAMVVLSVVGVGALLAPFHSPARRVHEDLARAREQMASETLARARTLEQVGTKVGHELKNPLSAVKVLVQLVLRDTDECASQRQERLQIAEKEIARMQHILGDYLSFSRPLQELRPEPLDLGALVAETLLMLSAHADQRRVRLTSHGAATVQADPRRVKDAIVNLVANAIEATLPGGEVEVEVRPRGAGVELIVRDSGRGMSPGELGRLGTPFFTTREDGTGLGVVLARSAVAQHGGSLRYESVQGKGTTATVTLPAHPPGRFGDVTRTARG
jgi:two-component system, NtrC family, sensor histidine kinase HydH